MDNTEENIGSVKKQLAANDSACLEDDDEKQFHKLFTELVAECTASDDPKIADSMKWLKQASLYSVNSLLTRVAMYTVSQKTRHFFVTIISSNLNGFLKFFHCWKIC